MKTLPFIISHVIFSACFCQEISPQSLNSAGTKMTQANGSISFTVGELVVLSLEDNQGNTLNGGFNTNAVLTTLSIQEADISIMSVSIFPNPSSNFISIVIKEVHIDEFNLDVKDLKGKLILSEKHSGVSSNIGINATSWDSGSYILTLYKLNGELIGSYQIIKQ